MRKFNVTVPLPKYPPGSGTWWHNVGRAYENDKGQIHVTFYSTPLPDDKGEVRVVLFEKTDDAPKGDEPWPGAKKVDDEIPY